MVSRRIFVVLFVFVTLAALVTPIVLRIRNQRQWFAIQGQQLEVIKQLGDHPPPGWERRAWESALVLPYNVWGNVTYHPDYSKISNAEMRELKLALDQIAAETYRENSMDSVDRVFALLQQRGQKTRFISGYRDEFRTYNPTPPAESP